jgi:hypothetical protein
LTELPAASGWTALSRRGEARRRGGESLEKAFILPSSQVLQNGTPRVARFHDFFGVVAGTSLGMMIANVPAILPGALALFGVGVRPTAPLSAPMPARRARAAQP